MSDNRSEDPKYVQWAKAIKTKYNFTCQICNIVSNFKIQLDSHHLDSWDWAVKSRYSIDNGICLCSQCHQRYHQYTSYGKNTKENFLAYLPIAKVFHEVLLKDPTVKIAKIFLKILSSDQLKPSLKEVTEIKEILNKEEDPNEKGEK